MKICRSCGVRFDRPGWDCPECFYKIPHKNGFPLLSLCKTAENEGFNPGNYSILADFEDESFWFRARNRLIVWSLARFFPTAEKFLEVGCGTGYVLSGIEAAFPHLKLWGSEIHAEGLSFARNRIRKGSLFQMDAREIPYEEEFDVIGAFDVLEHIKDDLLVLEQMRRAVHPGGGIIITVPQHPFLWSPIDDYSRHVRRYLVQDLRMKVKKAGFEIQRVTSFVSLLFPLMLCSRWSRRKLQADDDSIQAEFRIGRRTNRLLEMVMDVERMLIQRGLCFPFGGSLCLVARRL